jgi:hypothetical protein
MQKADHTRPVLTIGMDLSGLTVGRLLTNNGIANIVFEVSPPERSQGFAISLHDWGCSRLLEALGGLSLRTMTKAMAPDRFIGGTGWVDLVVSDNTNRGRHFSSRTRMSGQQSCVRIAMPCGPGWLTMGMTSWMCDTDIGSRTSRGRSATCRQSSRMELNITARS